MIPGGQRKATLFPTRTSPPTRREDSHKPHIRRYLGHQSPRNIPPMVPLSHHRARLDTPRVSDDGATPPHSTSTFSPYHPHSLSIYDRGLPLRQTGHLEPL